MLAFPRQSLRETRLPSTRKRKNAKKEKKRIHPTRRRQNKRASRKDAITRPVREDTRRRRIFDQRPKREKSRGNKKRAELVVPRLGCARTLGAFASARNSSQKGGPGEERNKDDDDDVEIAEESPGEKWSDCIRRAHTQCHLPGQEGRRSSRRRPMRKRAWIENSAPR